MQKTAEAGKPAPTRASPGNDVLASIELRPVRSEYRIPSMAETAAVPWNGMTVASTFSGCGGSCLGYRMAGFRVGWANEFVPSAQESYRLNAAPGSFLDCRDVRDVQPGDVLKQMNLGIGDLDLFDGSPPCQAFSTAGKRHKGWGRQKKYEGGHEQRNEDMFQEWLRLLRGLMPRAFLAENVSGLVKGTCKGVFLEVLAAMKAAGYRVRAAVLDAQWLGVPQVRKRVIFAGVREDLRDAAGRPLEPSHPKPLRKRWSVAEALPWIAGVDQGAVYGEDNRFSAGSEPSPTVSLSGIGAQVRDRVRMVPKLRKALPNLSGGENDEVWLDAEKHPYPTIGSSPGAGCGVNNGGGKIEDVGSGSPERRRFTIAELRRICGFPDDFLLAGSYAKQWERLGNSVPPPMAFWAARELRETLRKEVGRKLPEPRDPRDLVRWL